MALKNPWGKMRPKENPYYVTEHCGFKIHVLKANRDLRKPFASAYVWVTGPSNPSGDCGDDYAAGIPGLIQAWTRAAIAATVENVTDSAAAALSKGD